MNGSIQFQGTTGGTVGGAREGASLNGGFVELGRLLGSAPGLDVMTQPRELQLGSFLYQFDPGRFLIYDGFNRYAGIEAVQIGSQPAVFAARLDDGTKIVMANWSIWYWLGPESALTGYPTIQNATEKITVIPNGSNIKRGAILLTNGATPISNRHSGFSYLQDAFNEPVCSVDMQGGADGGVTRNFFVSNSGPGTQLVVNALGGEQIKFPGGVQQPTWTLAAQDGFMCIEKAISGWYVTAFDGAWV